MFKRFLTVMLLLVLATGVFAQRYRPYGGSLSIYSIDVPFFLYINHVLYNSRPSTDIRVANLRNPRYDLRIVFADSRRRTLNGSGVQLVNRDGQYMDVVFSVSSRRGNSGIVLESMNPAGRYNSNPRDYRYEGGDRYDEGRQREEQYSRSETGEEYGDQQGENNEIDEREEADEPFEGSYIEKNNANQLNDLLNQKENDEGRLQVAAEELKTMRLRTAEIIDLMELFIRDDNKLAFAKYAYPSCIDKQNYNQVGDALSFTSTRDKLTAFLSSREK
ncbi:MULTISPECIES: DUF4476 domain-containing protein [Sphingobacterium]|uniref:DUF4476 domain-containing protein n=1 Tax=Sphingobacterium TaxID=28453 RepID=UPI0022442E5A|nr:MULTISPECIES: DUF4476 domain-containing protein [Sphingobacterium]MCW8312709.1 DUF4476 domain-containing protein [Sphingobacterium sp. InxBP1]